MMVVDFWHHSAALMVTTAGQPARKNSFAVQLGSTN
jgi:hypothetical protein